MRGHTEYILSGDHIASLAREAEYDTVVAGGWGEALKWL